MSSDLTARPPRCLGIVFLLVLLVPTDIAWASDIDEGPTYGDWVLLGGLAAILLLPVAALIVWLKGRRNWALVGIIIWLLPVASYLYPIGNLEDLEGQGSPLQEWLLVVFFEFQVVANTIAIPFVIVLVSVAFRVAEPSSWWAQRWYGAEKFRRALERSRG